MNFEKKSSENSDSKSLIEDNSIKNSKDSGKKDFANKKSDEPRCFWCHNFISESKIAYQTTMQGKREEEIKFWVCSNEHEMRVKRYFQFIDRFYFLYILFVLISPIIFIILAIYYQSMIFIFPIFSSIGIGLLIIPLLGEQIRFNLGIKNANMVSRILGLILLIIGFVLISINGYKIFVN